MRRLSRKAWRMLRRGAGIPGERERGPGRRRAQCFLPRKRNAGLQATLPAVAAVRLKLWPGAANARRNRGRSHRRLGLRSRRRGRKSGRRYTVCEADGDRAGAPAPRHGSLPPGGRSAPKRNRGRCRRRRFSDRGESPSQNRATPKSGFPGRYSSSPGWRTRRRLREPVPKTAYSRPPPPRPRRRRCEPGHGAVDRRVRRAAGPAFRLDVAIQGMYGFAIAI